MLFAKENMCPLSGDVSVINDPQSSIQTLFQGFNSGKCFITQGRRREGDFQHMLYVQGLMEQGVLPTVRAHAPPSHPPTGTRGIYR